MRCPSCGSDGRVYGSTFRSNEWSRLHVAERTIRTLRHDLVGMTDSRNSWADTACSLEATNTTLRAALQNEVDCCLAINCRKSCDECKDAPCNAVSVLLGDMS